MVVVEHEGTEYALVTHNGEMSWVNARNRKASEELTVILREQALQSGVSDAQLSPPKPKTDIQGTFKVKARRLRKKKGSIAVKVNLKRDRS